MSIRTALPSEASELTDLAVRAKASWGYDAAFLTAFREFITVTEHDVTHGAFWVFEGDGRLSGFVRLTDDPPTLSDLWVEPAVHRVGVGRSLAEHALGEAKRYGWDVLLVESDPFAVGFYERLGFERVGERESPLQKGRMLPLLRYRL